MTTSAENLKQQLDELTEPQLQQVADLMTLLKSANPHQNTITPCPSTDLPPDRVCYLATMINDMTEGERQNLIKELHPNQYFKEKLNNFLITANNTIIDFTFNDTDFKIFSLNDHDYRNLSAYFINLNFSYCFSPTFWRTSSHIFNRGWWTDSKTETIAHIGFIYWILSYLFGESSQIVYEEKSTFAFRFYLEVKKEDKTYPYAFAIFDYRNCVEFSFYRCSHEKVTPTVHLEKPNETEFSADEIDKFIIYFLGYLLGVFKLVKKEITPFQRVIPSNCFVYGYSQENGFFEYEQEYDQAL